MTIARARHLRKNASDVEKLLWSHLRNRQTAGLKFRRQHSVGQRVVDFFCAEAKLAIELDGSGHTMHLQQTADLDRQIDLYENGIRILRFHNNEIFTNLDGVLNAIIYAVDPGRSLWAKRSERPHLYPLPQGEENQR